MKTIKDTQKYLDELTEIVELLEDKKQVLEFVIEQGESLERFPENKMLEKNLVKGCNSPVFIDLTVVDGKVNYLGFSDSLIIKGYMSIMLNALNGLAPKDVLLSEKIFEDFLQKTKLNISLISTRANAFGSIYKKILDLAKKRV